MKKLLFIFAIPVILHSCTEKNTENKLVSHEVIGEGDSIINLAIDAHGGSLYESAAYEFVFRDVLYTFQNEKDEFTYTKTDTSNSQTTKDKMTKTSFERYIDGEVQLLTDEEVFKYRESLNSVIYFATLPYKLNDKAVNKTFIEKKDIKGVNYYTIEVSFDEDGGGEDHDDVFYYWVNETTHRIDYLAYQYATNGGGVRFRSANNTRVVKGIAFQDYVNYGAPVGTNLGDLPELYERNELKELSLINTEDVKAFKPE